MAQNTAAETVNDDGLADDALGRSNEGTGRAGTHGGASSFMNCN
jgi:hypothetical protein